MRRRVLSLLLMFTLILSCFGNAGMAYAGNGKGKKNGKQTEGDNSVIYASQAYVNGKELVNPQKEYGRDEVRNNLLGLLPADTEIKDSLSLGGKTVEIDKAMFVTGSASLSGTDVTVSKPLVAKGDINISATNITIKDAAFLVSVNGSINFYCTSISVEGPISAKSEVFITGSKTIIREAVFANTFQCYTGNYQSDNTVDESKWSARKDLLAELSLYEEDGKDYFYANANFTFVSMEIYGRKDGENTFTLLKNDVTEDFEIPSLWDSYTDYAAVLVTDFGYAYSTDPLSVEKENGILYCSSGTDSDGDGVTDAYEIWLSKTDPVVADSFPDEAFYVSLTDEYGTTCYDRLLRRDVSYTTADYTKTYTYDTDNRISNVMVSFRDGATKQIRYSYENDRLKDLYVGNNRYTVSGDDEKVLYQVNGTAVKKINRSQSEESVTFFDTTDETYRYDSEKNLTEFRSQSVYELSYDELDLIDAITKNGFPYATFSYDDYGNYLSIDATEYSIHYTYNYPLYQADYSFGNLRKIQKVNCKDDSYAYGDIILLTDGTDGAAVPKNRIGEILSSDAENRTLRYKIGAETHTVEFNTRGYVIKDSVTDGIDDFVTEYSYDTYGNLLKTETTKNGQKETHTYGYASEWSDELVTFDGKAIGYDTLGKPSSYYNGSSFTWAAGKLATVQDGEISATYHYDYKGLRDEKTVNGITTEFIYEGHDLIAELGDDPMYYTYDGNFSLIGFERGGSIYYYQYDIFGDVIGIVNDDGEQLCSYSYDLWGELLSVTGDEELALRNPFRYRGYYYDNESGFYYLESRYYDPHTKRFLSYDDLESFFYGEEEDMESLFVYCGNNPTVFLDKNGRLSYKNEIFTLNEFRDESVSVSTAINKYFSGKGASSSTPVYRFASEDYFVQLWNYSNAKNIIIINSHGEPGSIGTKNIDITISVSMVKNRLNYKNIGLVWLLGCSCGHYDYDRPENNIARAFAKKISGTVIAADSTSKAVWYSDTTFRSKGEGWFAFSFYNYGSTFYLKKLGIKNLSVKKALEIVGY